MNILLIEDDATKRSAIRDFIVSIDDIEDTPAIDEAETLAEARRLVLTKAYDLIVFDIYLPIRKGEREQDVADDIVCEFVESKNCRSEAITITRYRMDSESVTNLFNDNGITVVGYSDDCDRWKAALHAKVLKVAAKPKVDFLIFCALNKERSAYEHTGATVGRLKVVSGLDCQEITVSEKKGLCIVPNRPGLVNMAITASKAIELFQPTTVAMSGICAGVPGESDHLDVIVADVCWEYQTGKFKDNQFVQEPYQASISSQIRTSISQLIEDNSFIGNIKEGLFETELKSSKVVIKPISSGSAVIADEQKMSEIGLQHRKMAGLEMEMYAVYEAAHQSPHLPVVFGAKAVVDMGDTAKGDDLHTTGCILSARAVVNIIIAQIS